MPSRDTGCLSAWESVAYAAAGPAANLATYVLLGLPAVAEPLASSIGGSFIGDVADVVRTVSLPLGLFNLLPLGSLDGGQIVSAAVRTLPGRRRVLALRSFQSFSLMACTVIIHALWVSDHPRWLVVVNALGLALIGGGVLLEDPYEGATATPRSGRSRRPADPRQRLLPGLACRSPA